jgi:hypothetical protein
VLSSCRLPKEGQGMDFDTGVQLFRMNNCAIEPEISHEFSATIGPVLFAT